MEPTRGNHDAAIGGNVDGDFGIVLEHEPDRSRSDNKLTPHPIGDSMAGENRGRNGLFVPDCRRPDEFEAIGEVLSRCHGVESYRRS
jgi:hypothetical protein